MADLIRVTFLLSVIFVYLIEHFSGGTLKIYGEALCKDVPYKTLLLSVRDCAGAVVREMLEKYGLSKTDPSQWCLVQVKKSLIKIVFSDCYYILYAGDATAWYTRPRIRLGRRRVSSEYIDDVTKYG